MDKNLQVEYNNLYNAYKELEDSKLILLEKNISKIL